MGVGMEKKINDFIVFCLEIYKANMNITGEEAFEIFKEYEVLEYLKSGYEMLHTQGEEWLINDIVEFLKNRGYNNK